MTHTSYEPGTEKFLGFVGGKLTNPESVLIRPADTTAYAQNDLIANSTTAGNVRAPFFSAPRVPGGSFILRRFRLLTNLTTGFSTFQGLVEFWSKMPTFTNGDNAAYAVATGALSYLGRSTTSVATQVADGAYCEGDPDVGSEFGIKLGSGDAVFWSLKEVDATGFTPISGQRFILVPEIYQN